MRTRNMLYRREYDINDAIHIKIPTVGEILECEDGYYSIVAMLTAMPIDMMVQLDDIGIDFTTIDEYDGSEFEIMLTGPTHFSVSNADEGKYYSGISESASLVEDDAVWNENAMMGGEPFSMVIVTAFSGIIS